MIGDQYLQVRGELGQALTTLTTLAQDLRAPEEMQTTLQSLQHSLREPFLFVVAGEVKAGKSSLLNALFGRDFCKVDVLPATDKVYLFKYGEENRTVHMSDRLAECYRDATFLKDFNIVDTPGTNTIVAEHQTITEQFVPLADLVLFVFSATNPWAASAWEFLRLISKRWLKRVVFVLQQADLRAPDEIAAIVKHLEQTMLEKIGHACPVFPVSAKKAFIAKTSGGDPHQALVESGFDKLEAYINDEIASGEARLGKLRSVCQTSQVILRELGEKVREAMAVVEEDTKRLAELDHTMIARKEQSIRQLSGVLWTLTQSYEKAQREGEDLLMEKLTLPNTVKLILNKGDWRYDFQKKLEDQLRETLQRQIGNSLELLEGDLRSVWQQLHDTLQRNFADKHRTAATLPDFLQRRDELLRKIDLTLLEKGTSQQVEQQLGRLFEETANWLRVPAGVAAAGGVATIIAILAHSAVFDVTGIVAGSAAAAGTVIALVKRRKIRDEFRKQMVDKRDSTLSGVEDHLRHAIDRFYQELSATFQPFQSFCAAQRSLYEPMLNRLRELDGKLSKYSGDLSAAAREEGATPKKANATEVPAEPGAQPAAL